MAPCKHWMRLGEDDRLNDEYELGVDNFIKFAFERTGEDSEIKCRCIRCKNAKFGSREMVSDHLKTFGILPGYTFWFNHGERIDEPHSNCDIASCAYENSEDDDEIQECVIDKEMRSMLRDVFPSHFVDAGNCLYSSLTPPKHLSEEPNEDAQKFYRLFEDFQTPLYDGSKISKLAATVNLLNLKTIGRWSNKSFTMLLQFLKTQLLPQESALPDNYYSANRDLGLSYTKIHACVNDCMLFWKNDEKLDFCKVCGEYRWELGKHNGEHRIKKNGKKMPRKILQYFPLKLRLQRIFMCSKIASDMTWHYNERIKDGVLRHPADAEAWIHFDKEHPNFSLEPRNVILGLISDGFEPFSFSATPYSVWPVLLVPYNLPPWLCMKKSSLMLSMLIPGPKGPGDAIDVYLQPLIEELKDLWVNGVETYDASRESHSTLKAALLSTINDFPAYGILSGWSTKGKIACPVCNKKTHHKRLKFYGKQIYMRHRRFLPINHPLRKLGAGHVTHLEYFETLGYTVHTWMIGLDYDGYIF